MGAQSLDDELLINRVINGDRTAMDDLIYRHQARAYQFAFRLTRNPDDASDIVAEAFVRVFTALPNFKGRSAFTTWLYRIITNCFLDARKKDKSSSTVSLDSSFTTDEGEVQRQIEDDAPSPQMEMEKKERVTRLTDAISQLSEYQKAMILMYHAEQLSYEEIAAALDLPIGTVKSRLNRARQQLHQLLRTEKELFEVREV